MVVCTMRKQVGRNLVLKPQCACRSMHYHGMLNRCTQAEESFAFNMQRICMHCLFSLARRQHKQVLPLIAQQTPHSCPVIICRGGCLTSLLCATCTHKLCMQAWRAWPTCTYGHAYGWQSLTVTQRFALRLSLWMLARQLCS